jgi:hypothetical protein
MLVYYNRIGYSLLSYSYISTSLWFIIEKCLMKKVLSLHKLLIFKKYIFCVLAFKLVKL